MKEEGTEEMFATRAEGGGAVFLFVRESRAE